MLRATLKSLLAHKLRFLLTGLAVVLGVAFMAGTFVLTDTVQRVFDDLFSDIGEDVDAYARSSNVVEQDFGPDQRARIPQTLVEPVAAVDGVDLAVPDFELGQGVRLLDTDGEAVGNPAMGAPTLGFAWEDITGASAVTFTEGGPPTTTDEVVLNKAAADDAGFSVGDEVRVTTPFGDPEKPYTLSGIVQFAGRDSAAGAITVFFELEEIQFVAGALPPMVAEPEITGVVIRGVEGVSQEELAERVSTALDAAGVEDVEVITGAALIEENQATFAEFVGFLNIILTTAGAIALLVGAFIIFNTFSIVVTQRTRELALLRALGASGRQVRSAVLGEALLVGIGASLFGLLVGIGLAKLLTAALSSFGLDLSGRALSIPPQGLVIAFLVGVVITVASAILPARKAARLPPLAAIRDVAVEDPRLGRRTAIGAAASLVGLLLLAFGLGIIGDVDNKIYYVGFGALVVFLGVTVLAPAIARPITGTLGWPVEKLRGVTGQIARANAIRNPRRTASTASALMIGVALVVLIFVLAASIQRSVSVAVDRSFTVDAIVGEEGASGFGVISPLAAEAVIALPEVEVASSLRFGPAEFDGDSEFFGSLDTQVVDQLFEMDMREGAASDIGLDDVGISQKVADEKGWGLGDVIPTDFGLIERDLTVTAVFGHGEAEGLSDFLISHETYDEIGLPPGDMGLYVVFADGVDVQDGMAAVETAIEPYPSLEVIDRQGLKDQITGQINQFIQFLFVLLALAIVIAFVGILNTLALSVLERVREIGLLRAVGMTRRQLRSSIRWEAVLVALFGAVLGLVVGLVFGWAIVRALASEGITEFSAAPLWLAVVTICAALFGVLAAIWPARRAARMNVLEAVSTDE